LGLNIVEEKIMVDTRHQLKLVSQILVRRLMI